MKKNHSSSLGGRTNAGDFSPLSSLRKKYRWNKHTLGENERRRHFLNSAEGWRKERGRAICEVEQQIILLLNLLIYIYILAILIWNVIYVLCFSYRLSLLLAIQKYLQIKQSVRDRDTNKYPRRTRQGCYLRIFKQMRLQMELSILNKTSVKN